jgi:major membrane immunogen (membrane-anchored lipoprotein)
MKINRVGAIGEIYTDTETGKMYKCTYSYKDSNGNFDCTWKEVSERSKESANKVSVGEVPTNKIESEKIPEGKISEKHSERSSDSISNANGNEEIVEEKPAKEYPNHKPNKTKYTNYSKR